VKAADVVPSAGEREPDRGRPVLEDRHAGDQNGAGNLGTVEERHQRVGFIDERLEEDVLPIGRTSVVDPDRPRERQTQA
jgi:hypothetical protein